MDEQPKKQDSEVQDQKPQEEKKGAEQISEEKIDSVTQGWGDPTFNPIFLKVAEYFGITQKDMSNASSKLNIIIDWAAAETNSKNPSDILLKIAETSKGLDAPGMQERRYAILHKYIKLSNLRRPIVEQMEKLQKQRDDLEKEMRAYGNASMDKTA